LNAFSAVKRRAHVIAHSPEPASNTLGSMRVIIDDQDSSRSHTLISAQPLRSQFRFAGESVLL
jgi:hypothetical protein